MFSEVSLQHVALYVPIMYSKNVWRCRWVKTDHVTAIVGKEARVQIMEIIPLQFGMHLTVIHANYLCYFPDLKAPMSSGS